MARRSQTAALTGANYKQFAALVLVGALSVALFGGSGGGAEPVAAPVPQVVERPAPVPVSEASEDAGGEFFAAEGEASGFAPEEAAVSEDEQPAAELATSETGEPAPGAKPADTGPTPDQIARLIEASRERSGARPGGD